MKLMKLLCAMTLFLSLTSCIEIIDDLSISGDGSGTFKYHINLSSSKIKINSILALDSLDGKKVPSIAEIQSRADKIVKQLKEQNGITNVVFDANYTDFIFKVTCDFNNLNQLQSAIVNVIKSESKEKEMPELNHTWVSFSQNTLKRSVPQITIKKAQSINKNDSDLLKQGSYTSITRFEKEIERIENENANLSKNKKAVMIRTDPYSLTQNPHLLDNMIYLVKTTN
jgi:hypothetical protein